MMKIRYLLLVSISYIGLSSLAQADISKGGKEFIFTHTYHNTHLDSRSQLLSSPNLMPSPTLVANVCFVTDTGECRGNEFGTGNSPDPVSPPPGSSGSSGSSSSSSGSSSSGSSSSGSSSSGGDECDPNDAWCIDNQKRCDWEGYLKTSKDCNEVQIPHNYCPYDRTYFEKCICDPTLISCPSPLQGVGRECNGKYRSCKCPDNFQSCECGPASGAIACTWNGRTTYSGCKACCTPYSDETGCSCGTYSCSDGCGGSRQCCSSCPSTSSSSGSSGSSSSGGNSSEYGCNKEIEKNCKGECRKYPSDSAFRVYCRCDRFQNCPNDNAFLGTNDHLIGQYKTSSENECIAYAKSKCGG